MTPTLVASAGFAALVLHLVIRALKSGQATSLLASLGLPALPAKALPWLSIGLGMAAGLASALAQGEGWQDALQAIFMGLFAGTGAIAIHETASQFEKLPEPLKEPMAVSEAPDPLEDKKE